jgi:hypothetical protein
MTLQEYYWRDPPLLDMRGVPIVDIINIGLARFILEHSAVRMVYMDMGRR